MESFEMDVMEPETWKIDLDFSNRVGGRKVFTLDFKYNNSNNRIICNFKSACS